jgi:ubiquitin carboxyl-terminal hydrolase 22/27/51
MGQTCFMSVVLQTLLHNPFVRDFYLSEGHRKEDCGKEGCVSCALDEMFVEFYSTEKTEGFGAVNMLMGSWLAGEV